MPEVNKTPAAVRPYTWYGLDLSHGPTDQWVGDCPFCARPKKWYVHDATGKWDCKLCAATGNLPTFLTRLYAESERVGSDDDYRALAENRGLLDPDTLREWGLRKSLITGEWLVPGYSCTGKLVTLYRYARPPGGKKPVLMICPGAETTLAGVHALDRKRADVYLAEGLWDAMILWETMGYAKGGADGLLLTGNGKASLQSKANVLAVPGANTFKEDWAGVLGGKRVVLLYDNDHPTTHPTSGAVVPPAAYDGMRRAFRAMSAAPARPESVAYLEWGPGGYDPRFPSGYDLRDALNGTTDRADRVAKLDAVLRKVRPTPADWVPGGSKGGKAGSTEATVIPCKSWADLRSAWQKAMKWDPPGEGLDLGLSFMLAVAASTELQGDQLWGKVVAPPSGGKTTLADGLAMSRKHVISVDKITGFHSGFTTDPDGKEDNSLIARLPNKTLILKDGDTLLQQENLPQILSEARGIYDRKSNVSYRNKVKRDYTLSMTFLICGTPSLHALDDSELGQRFLDCVLMDEIDDAAERAVNNRRLRQLAADMIAGPVTGGDGDGEDKTAAKRLTGGYLEHLRAVVQSRITEAGMPDDSTFDAINDYGQFVAYMRARPSKRQDEVVQREVSTRLATQLYKLANCLMVVLDRPRIDADVLARVRRVALSTGRGRVLGVCNYLYRVRETGAVASAVSTATGEGDAKTGELLRFLRRIKIVHLTDYRPPGAPRPTKVYRMTPALDGLYRRVVLGEFGS